MMTLQLQADRVGNSLCVNISGDLVLGQSLRGVSQAIRDSGPIQAIILDLTHCTRVDSSGIGELLLCYSLATREHKKLFLTGVGPHARDVMRIACVDAVLLILPSREAALAAAEA